MIAKNISSINVIASGIEINNQLFEFPFLLSNLEALLGEPDRIYEGEPDHDRGFSWTSRQVWDELGISTISDRATPTLDVIEFELQLSERKQYDYVPNHPFLGKLTINHKKIDELVTITNQYYTFPYKDLSFKDMVVTISLIRTKKINEIASIIVYKDKK